ncbi:MAG: hypothetical protein IKL05_06425 [Clostridia bacterium]|nr:hypothetical protein [Clostridia bacterium]
MKFKVTEQNLEIQAPAVISEGAINFVTFELSCDESWAEFVKTVRFKHENSDDVYDMPDIKEGVTYYVPAEVLAKGKVYVGVLGVFAVEHVATTTKAYFTVDEAVEHGKTPSTTPDAYAKYVNDVVEHRKASEGAKKAALDCLEKCQKLISDAETFSRAAVISRYKTEKLAEEVSGMLDAVGVVFGDIKRIEERLTSIDGMLSNSEQRRDNGEQVRILSENGRAYSEEDRRSRESERVVAETMRATAENLRALNEERRDRKLCDVDERLKALENADPAVLTCITAVAEGEGEVILTDDCITNTDFISLFGNTSVVDGRLYGVGEKGFVTLKINDKIIDIPISQPLQSAGEVRDELRLCPDGSVTVIRRTAKMTVEPNASILRDSKDSGRIMYVTPLTSPTPSLTVTDGVSNMFSYGSEVDRDSVWIGGEYVFLYLDKSAYPDSQTLCERLTENPLNIVYPIFKETFELEGSITPFTLDSPVTVSTEGRLSVQYKKDIFKAFEKIGARLKSLDEKTKEEKDDNSTEINIA